MSGWIVELGQHLLVPSVVPEQWQVPRRAQHVCSVSCQDSANPGIVKPAKKGQHFRMKWCHCCASCSKYDAVYNVPFVENTLYRRTPSSPRAVRRSSISNVPFIQPFHPALAGRVGWFPTVPCTPLGPAASLQKLRLGESLVAESGWDPGQLNINQFVPKGILLLHNTTQFHLGSPA